MVTGRGLGFVDKLKGGSERHEMGEKLKGSGLRSSKVDSYSKREFDETLVFSLCNYYS